MAGEGGEDTCAVHRASRIVRALTPRWQSGTTCRLHVVAIIDHVEHGREADATGARAQRRIVRLAPSKNAALAALAPTAALATVPPAYSQHRHAVEPLHSAQPAPKQRQPKQLSTRRAERRRVEGYARSASRPRRRVRRSFGWSAVDASSWWPLFNLELNLELVVFGARHGARLGEGGEVHPHTIVVLGLGLNCAVSSTSSSVREGHPQRHHGRSRRRQTTGRFVPRKAETPREHTADKRQSHWAGRRAVVSRRSAVVSRGRVVVVGGGSKLRMHPLRHHRVVVGGGSKLRMHPLRHHRAPVGHTRIERDPACDHAHAALEEHPVVAPAAERTLRGRPEAHLMQRPRESE